jgi:hypothetical protein
MDPMLVVGALFAAMALVALAFASRRQGRGGDGGAWTDGGSAGGSDGACGSDGGGCDGGGGGD